MKKLFKKIGRSQGVLFSLVQSSAIAAVVLLAVSHVSCKMTETGISVSEGDYTTPVLESYSLTGEKTMRLVFSKKITLENLNLTPEVEIDSVSYDSQENSICFADVTFSSGLEIGREYSLFGDVIDESGNSLTFCIPFSGYNAEIPVLEITEIRQMYKGESKGDGKFYCEYVELCARTDGNLAGLELFSVSDGEEKKFVLPAVRVSEGDIVVVHLRSKGEGCISELDDDLNLSYALGSASGVRDLWDENEDARLNDTADVVVLRNSADGTLLDVVPYAKTGTENWKNETFSSVLGDAVSQKLWSPDSSIGAAVNADGITATKSLLKIKDGHSAECWQVSATNGGTPGTL